MLKVVAYWAVPEWYFIFMFQTLKMIPAHVLFIEGELLGILFFLVAGLAWALVPFWELKSKRKGLSNPMNIIGLIAILFIVIMTIIGYTS